MQLFDVRFLKFLLVGLVNTFVGLLCMLYFDSLFGHGGKSTNLLLSYVVVFFVGHFVSRKFVWKSKNPYWVELAKYSLSYLPSLIPSVLGFMLFSLLLNFNYIFVQTAISVSTACFVFLLQKFHVFNKRRKNKAVFFDRDGVINELVPPLLDRGPREIAELKIVPGVLEVINKCEELGYLCLVVTNQPDVSRGFLSKQSLKQINDEIAKTLPGIRKFYTCEHDNNDSCICRKPAPGLLIKAQRDFFLNLSECYFVGDKWTDVLAAQRAGVVSVLLAGPQSNSGGSQGLKPRNLVPDHEIDKLSDLFEFIS